MFLACFRTAWSRVCAVGGTLLVQELAAAQAQLEAAMSDASSKQAELVREKERDLKALRQEMEDVSKQWEVRQPVAESALVIRSRRVCGTRDRPTPTKQTPPALPNPGDLRPSECKSPGCVRAAALL